MLSHYLFLLANVIINGVLGTLAIQPPVAIWWWLSVGAIGVIYNFDKSIRISKNETKIKLLETV